jgi:hypothetical protein
LICLFALPLCRIPIVLSCFCSFARFFAPPLLFDLALVLEVALLLDFAVLLFAMGASLNAANDRDFTHDRKIKILSLASAAIRCLEKMLADGTVAARFYTGSRHVQLRAVKEF